MALQQHFGMDLAGKTVAWVGDGNNVLHDLMLGSVKMGMNVNIATPAGYEPNADILALTKQLAAENNAKVFSTTVADEAGAPIRTAWLTSIVPDDVVELLTSRGHVALHPWVKLLRREVIDACHAAGIEVNTWTCDDPERMAELVGWGIDGLCTNLPDVALTVLGRGAPA